MVSFKVLVLSACLVSSVFGKATLGALGGLGGLAGAAGGITGGLGGAAGGLGALGGAAGGLTHGASGLTGGLGALGGVAGGLTQGAGGLGGLGGLAGAAGGVAAGLGGLAGAAGGLTHGASGLTGGLGALGGVAGGLTHAAGGLGGLGGLAGAAGGVAAGLGGLGGLGGGHTIDNGGLIGGGSTGVLPGGPIGAISGILKNFAGGIIGDAAGVGAVASDILSLRFPAAIDDAFNIVRISARAVSGAVAQIFPGFGVLLDGVSQTIVRIAQCVFGSQGIAGAIHQDRRPGQLNGGLSCNGLPVGHGIGGVDLTKYADELGIRKILKNIDLFIASILKGRDISELSRSQIIVIQSLRKLSILLQKTNFTRADVSAYITLSITLEAAIINSKTPNAGNDLIKHLIVVLDPVLQKNGFGSISGQVSVVLQTLEGTSDNCGCWSKSNNNNSQEEESNESQSNENGGYKVSKYVQSSNSDESN